MDGYGECMDGKRLGWMIKRPVDTNPHKHLGVGLHAI